MACRQPCATASTLEVAVPNRDLTLEADEGPTAPGPNPAVLAVDNPPFVGGVEDFPRKRWVRGDGFEPIDSGCEVEIVGFEMGQ